MKSDEERQSHPGWAVQFEDGSWLCIAHGAGQADDAFYASTYPSVEDATGVIHDCLREGDIPAGTPYRIVAAWEHCCEVMRHNVKTLREANKIAPADIMEMTWQLEEVIAKLKGK